MNLFKKEQNTSGYNTIPDAIAAGDETAAVPLGITILPPTMTIMDRRSSKKMMLALAAGVMLIVLAGGTVLMLAKTLDGGRTTTSAAEGLVVATEGNYIACLHPADGTFGGFSTTALNAKGHPSKFETCFYQTTSVSTYCWTKSWQYDGGRYFMCVPTDGWVEPNDGGPGSVWTTVGDDYSIPIRIVCGPPCHFQHPTFGWRDKDHHFLN